MKFESFVITDARDDGKMLGVTSEGKGREFFLVVNRNLATNELELSVGRHYTDLDSTPAFERSAPWTEDEVRGQLD